MTVNKPANIPKTFIASGVTVTSQLYVYVYLPPPSQMYFPISFNNDNLSAAMIKRWNSLSHL